MPAARAPLFGSVLVLAPCTAAPPFRRSGLERTKVRRHARIGHLAMTHRAKAVSIVFKPRSLCKDRTHKRGTTKDLSGDRGTLPGSSSGFAYYNVLGRGGREGGGKTMC